MVILTEQFLLTVKLSALGTQRLWRNLLGQLGKFDFGQIFGDVIELRLNFLDVTMILCLWGRVHLTCLGMKALVSAVFFSRGSDICGTRWWEGWRKWGCLEWRRVGVWGNYRTLLIYEELFGGRMSSLILLVWECRANTGWWGFPEDIFWLMIKKTTLPRAIQEAVPKVKSYLSGGVAKRPGVAHRWSG